MGLGNPGPEYENTRHNMGFKVVDLWCKDLGLTLSTRRFRARAARAEFRGNNIILLCPLSFMNLSGESVRACADYYDLETERILVVHDDLDIPLGRIKVARESGAGGHKGVSSIIRHLGSTGFCRVKIGIGHPRYGEAVEDYVLAPFYADERGLAEDVLRVAVNACELFVLEGVESAMNHINCQNLVN
ncbi:MAG: aminoacyl-tRNA hydrolase [Proteobacteria bacterium]|nr:aminoacyl-tRNA hydrolase [Desulfobacterales bacterium]MBL7102238.1 aminoacyl-tRNA hydrolase [Desulfobacteraceae bacterium]MBU0736290.1 aminoacyl-tRNA hydrolase [Pseudomonadota bacterium]MBL7171943.1 aminoacyl-tRNA hydrolase [Desulfobacteraceae bacterium]MBU0990232.1 aminoacyl-tRNA hydrolase [Pseudomonadota bacterium]